VRRRFAIAMKDSIWHSAMKDTIQILGDIVSPANNEDDWEVLQD
jgi:hypothetical protein